MSTVQSVNSALPRRRRNGHIPIAVFQDARPFFGSLEGLHDGDFVEYRILVNVNCLSSLPSIPNRVCFPLPVRLLAVYLVMRDLQELGRAHGVHFTRTPTVSEMTARLCAHDCSSACADIVYIK